MYSTGNYTEYAVINHNVKEYKKEYIYVYIYIYIYISTILLLKFFSIYHETKEKENTSMQIYGM